MRPDANRRCNSARGGSARPLRSVAVQGVQVAEAAGVVGVALEALPEGEGLIWALVGLR